MTTINNTISTWKVWLRNADGQTDTIEIENANNPLNAKNIGVDEYDRPGWYAVEARLVGTKKCTGQ